MLSIDHRRKPKEMEWIYLIQLKSRKLPKNKSKEGWMRTVSSKCGSQPQGSEVSKTERNRGLSGGGILGQCCEFMIP